jgi:hypothetical protein
MGSKLLVSMALATAALGVTAASAAAELEEAAWSTTSQGIALSGTVTLKKGGESATTCTFTTSNFNGSILGSTFLFQNGLYPLDVGCAGSKTFQWHLSGNPYWENGYYLELWGSSGTWAFLSPYGEYYPYAELGLVPFTNASGGTPSKITFNEAEIGQVKAYGQTLTMTGSLNVTTGSGGVLTLSH